MQGLQSSRIKTARIRKNLSIAELSQKLSIKEMHLVAIEEWNVKKLPSEIYVNGYLMLLSKYFDISYQELLDEYNTNKNLEFTENAIHKYNIKSEPFSNTNYLLWYIVGGTSFFILIIILFYSIIHSSGFFFLKDIEPSSLSSPFMIEDSNQQRFSYQSTIADTDLATKLLTSKSKDLDAMSSKVEIYTATDSWLLLKSKNKSKELYSGIITAKESPVVFKENLPLYFYLGSATSVRILVNGVQYNFNRHINANNTARFTIK